MTDTEWGRAVPNVMEMDTLPCRSRLICASSGVLTNFKIFYHNKM